MNQAILFNDDLSFDEERHAWVFSGLLEGNLLKIIIDEKYHSRISPIEDSIRFDWESKVEDWLKHYEPVGNEILLNLDD